MKPSVRGSLKPCLGCRMGCAHSIRVIQHELGSLAGADYRTSLIRSSFWFWNLVISDFHSRNIWDPQNTLDLNLTPRNLCDSSVLAPTFDSLVVRLDDLNLARTTLVPPPQHPSLPSFPLFYPSRSITVIKSFPNSGISPLPLYQRTIKTFRIVINGIFIHTPVLAPPCDKVPRPRTLLNSRSEH